jgi:DNA-directed RNA polymerase beta' subunit
MNLHALQSTEAEAELMTLTMPSSNIVSAQSSKPIMDIVQDSLLAIYMMTHQNKPLTKDSFINIAINSETCNEMDILGRMRYIETELTRNGKTFNSCLNGRGLISMVLPEDFNYLKTNNAMEEEPDVVIRRGVLISGAIDKQIVGSSYNSIIQVLNKEYGGKRACRFVDDVHFLTNNWLVSQELNKDGVSKTEEIEDYVQKCFLEAKNVQESTTNKGIKEVRINAALGKAKDVGLRIAKDSLHPENNFLQTVRSGSKGDFFNIAQITGVIGQQNICGKRMEYQLNNKSRALPHYPFDLTLTEEYESKGFISSSFIHGLNPKECYFHAMSGREGINDTAMGTAKSGYMQRRIIKLEEDMKVTYDGTVRDAQNNIYQFAYGNTGIDCKKTVRVGSSQEFCDVSRIIDRLNTSYEVEMERNEISV